MSRYVISGRATIAGTSALPLVSLYAVAAGRPAIAEWGLFNTTAVAVCVALNRLTTAGTPGAGLTEVAEDNPIEATLATGFAGHTVGPTITGEVRRATLGAAVGSGVIWTFGPRGLVIPEGTANGVGAIIPTGTGQILDYYIAWDE
jgi:hypothetical protein